MDTKTKAGCEEEFLETLPPSLQKLETSCQVPLGVDGPAALGEAAVAISSPMPTHEQEGCLVKTKYRFTSWKIPSRDWTERGPHIQQYPRENIFCKN